jgi:hypothetical protein
MIREDMGKIADASSANQERLISAVGGTADAVRESQQQTQQELGDLGDTVQGGFERQTAQQQLEQQELGQRINRVRGLLQQTGENLDQQTRQQYAELVSAFDQNGSLIERSIDRQGRTVSRILDEQGNLNINKFDGTGQRVGAARLDVGQMLTKASQFEQQLAQGSGQQSGIMTPYARTR